MNELYLSIKESISDNVKKGNLPQVAYEWEYHQLEENNLKSNIYPLILFKVKNIIYNNPDDRYLTGEMVFTVKVVFEGLKNKVETHQNVNDGFDLLKKIPVILRTVESQETGPINVRKMEVLEINDRKHCFQFISSTPYYPPFNSN